MTRRQRGELVFPVAGLLADPPGASRRLALGPVELDLGEDLTLAEPVRGELHLSRTNRGLLVRATLRTAIASACSRCLREIEIPIAPVIDEEVLPSVELTSGAPLDTSAEPDVLRLSQNHELDLDPLVREAISLAEPIAPLHSPDCAGLCVVCGADLNEPGHVAHEVDLDPRLEALQGFRVDAERETD